MRMNIRILPFAVLMLSASAYSAPDAFQKAKCDSDIPKAIMGQTMSNESITVIEGRHKDLGLNNLGAEELSDNLNAVFWRICGKRFVVLEDKRHVRDVLQLPNVADGEPEYIGRCRLDNKKSSEMTLAITNNKVVMAAWEISRKNGFVKVSSKAIQCP